VSHQDEKGFGLGPEGIFSSATNQQYAYLLGLDDELKFSGKKPMELTSDGNLEIGREFRLPGDMLSPPSLPTKRPEERENCRVEHGAGTLANKA
jgi:hypothetical protein